MTEELFELHLNMLCRTALDGGAVSFGWMVGALEFAKTQVMDLAKTQAVHDAQARAPRIVAPNGNRPSQPPPSRG